MKKILRTLGVLLLLGSAFFYLGCAKDPLEERLLSNKDAVRTKALQHLSRLKAEKTVLLIPPLIQALGNIDSQINQRAQDALVIIGPAAVPTLTGTLKDTDPYLRVLSAEILGRIGEEAAIAVPEIIQAVSDPHPLVREEAVIALRKMGPEAEQAVPALTKALRDAREEVRLAALISLEKIGTPEALAAVKKAPKKKP